MAIHAVYVYDHARIFVCASLLRDISMCCSFAWQGCWHHVIMRRAAEAGFGGVFMTSNDGFLRLFFLCDACACVFLRGIVRCLRVATVVL